MTTAPIILGTAGHIDHGKSALIKALTGVDPDRLKEEKLRGITIELGFADLTLPSGQHLGIVDVPGHERFVRHMVAGASGWTWWPWSSPPTKGSCPRPGSTWRFANFLGSSRVWWSSPRWTWWRRTGWSWWRRKC